MLKNPWPCARRRGRVGLLVALLLLQGGCASGVGTVCSGETVPATWADCGYTGPEDQPRLHSGESERQGDIVDVSGVNGAAVARSAIAFDGFVGDVRVSFTPHVDEIAADMTDLKRAGATRLDPDQRVTIDFNKATLDFVLKQLLGGALGVNYMAPEGLGGSVSFRTEVPIPKSQILQVVRDILGRNGLVVKYVNGVYQIGTAEVVASLQALSRAGNEGEQVTKIVQLSRGNGAQVAGLVRQLVPDGIALLPGGTASSVIVRAPANDIDNVEAMLRMLSASGVSKDQVAIVPLYQSDPTRMAATLSGFYGTLLPADAANALSIVPLEAQQALLIGAREPELMGGVQKLVRQLDRSASDVAALRIIPLKHLSADTVAEQLSKVFDAAVTTTDSAEPASPRSDPDNRLAGILAPKLQAGPGPLADGDDDMPLMAGPGLSMRPGQRSAPAGAADKDNSGDIVAARWGMNTGGGAAAGEGNRIVADTRTNTILVYSSYSTFKRMRDVLQALDVPQSQVIIEATVVEVDLSDQIDRGVQFFLEGAGFTARSSIEPDPTDLGRAGGHVQIGGMIGNVRADVVLSALQAITKVKVISSPYLTVLDGKSARLVIGDQIPYAVTSQSSNNLGNVTVTQEIEIRDTGIIMEVTPRIHANNSVALQIKQSVSTPSKTVEAGDRTPVIQTRDIQSDVLVQSGRTILLGGLIQDRVEKDETGVPILRSVPALGNLFKSKGERARRVELLIMITPRVIRNSSEIEDITRLLRTQFRTGFQTPAK